MNLKEYGILTQPETAVITILQAHKGEANAIPAQELAKKSKLEIRILRKTINHLIIDHGVEIASKAGDKGGYFLVASGAERQRFNQAFMSRASTGMTKAAAIAKASIVEVGLKMALARHAASHYEPKRHKVVGIGKTASEMLKMIFSNPKLYSKEIAALRREYSAVIIGKRHMEEINRAAKTLQNLTEGL